MLQIYWYCLDMGQTREKFVLESLEELRQLLIKHPLEVELNAKPLSGKAGQFVGKVFFESPKGDEGTLSACYDAILSKVSCDKFAPLVVYCRPDAKIAMAIKSERPLACWGVTMNHHISVVYNPENKYILWHEVLHLFDANDCYSYQAPNAEMNCELTNCIMQYAPKEQTVSKWPFICERNIKRIQKWSKNSN